MGYLRAEEILPIEIIELIQLYVDGTNIYIPRKQNNRQEWGSKTSIKSELQDRNNMIYKEYLSGKSVYDLSKSFCLSEKSIQRIVKSMKT